MTETPYAPPQAQLEEKRSRIRPFRLILGVGIVLGLIYAMTRSDLTFAIVDIVGFGTFAGFMIATPLVSLYAVMTGRSIKGLLFSRYSLTIALLLGCLSVLTLWLIFANADFR